MVILGGGASGLSLGLLTGAPIIEAAPVPGGHATSTIEGGYTFDRGPHIMFSRSRFLLDCMIGSLGSNVHTCRRNNKVHLDGVLAKYPIENDLAAFGPTDAAEMLTSFVTAPSTSPSGESPSNLADWFLSNFGAEMTRRYFRPYNEKVWKTNLEDLSMTWADRIPKPPPGDVIRGALGISTEGYLHQLHYQYPRVGGYSALMDAWATGITSDHLHLGRPVTRLRRVNGVLEVEIDDAIVSAREAVSTIPLPHLVEMFHGTPEPVKSAVRRLRTNATIVITLGFRGIDRNEWTAVYLPEPEYLPNRLSWPGVFSPSNTPDGCFSVQAEITCPTLSTLAHLTDDDLRDHVLEGLRSRELIGSEAELDAVFVDRYELAYVVYTPGYENDVALVRDWYETQGLHIHGRFGSHNYLNVDGCLGESISMARRLGASIDDTDIMQIFSALGA